jgi:hypothetical protein
VRFDWYECTVDQSADEFIASLIDGLDGTFKPGRGRQGYAHGCSIERDDRKLCEVWWGGDTQKDTAHAFASSDTAPAFAEFMRKLYPVHAVTRCDICSDWDEQGLYERLHRLGVELADRYNLKYRPVEEKRRGVSLGRTLYIGSLSSPHFMRVYEKGLEQAAKGVQASPHWVRVESVIKPAKKPQRLAVASLQPLELVGVSPFGRDYWSRLLGFEAEAFELHHSMPGDVDRALDVLCRQYGKVLAKLLTASGSPAAFGALLASRMAHHHPSILVPKP